MPATFGLYTHLLLKAHRHSKLTFPPKNGGRSEYPNSFSLLMAALLCDFLVSAEANFSMVAVAGYPSSVPAEHQTAGNRSRKTVPRIGQRIWGYQQEREYLFSRPISTNAISGRPTGEFPSEKESSSHANPVAAHGLAAVMAYDKFQALKKKASADG
jgi:hypothetical protein